MHKSERFSRPALRMLLAASACVLFGVTPARAGSYEDALSSARLGDTSQLVGLLERGIDPDTVDAQGNTLLILAAREGQLPTVEALLKHRAAVGKRNLAGDSALMLAVLAGHDRVVDTLLKAGAPVNQDGWTPLHYAAFEGRLALVDKLLAAGADVNALAPNKSTPLMIAARNGHIEVVRRLLKLRQVDLDLVNDAGLTADNWALQNSNSDIADLIRAERRRRGGKNPSITIEIE
ncbi:MAG: ankyrin repeat domain-containing protein [Proteobacteria bacterium]|nr:ankyrin repeat domain-containing protein [Pseudomonadota bacterium]